MPGSTRHPCPDPGAHSTGAWMEDTLVTLTTAICVGLGLGVGVLLLVAIARQFLFIGRPNEVLIFSGRRRKLADGSTVGYREVLGGGWAFRVPILEKVERMDLTAIPIDIAIQNAYSKGGIPLTVHAVANVKVSSDPRRVKNAIERFLGRDPAEIRRVAKETLEGHLRGVLATLTPEEVNEDRLKFASALVDEAEEDFHKLGLQLDVLKIQNVMDDVKYLDSIGRKRIAEVVRDAEIAESNAMAEAKEVEAAARQRAEVAVQTAQTEIVQLENALRQLKADLDAEARAAEERAEAAARQARAEAERQLQEIRERLEQLRLQADVVLPADAERQAQALAARGAAAAIEENGRALAQVLQMMTDTWLEAGPDAKDIFLIQQLETVLETVVKRVNDISLDEVHILDNGDGQALARHVAGFPAVVRQVLEEMKATTGIDVAGTLAGTTPTPPPAPATPEVTR
ncbi:MAG: flotillin family protein [Deltaproteobacteria bacterium]|nr:MAG: flotillin family protein [Deltaproteobacteria bacterium]